METVYHLTRNGNIDERGRFFVLFLVKKGVAGTTPNAWPPSHSSLKEEGNVPQRWRAGSPEESTLHQFHAQEASLQLVIVVPSLTSVLPDVLAMHTIEMIPKSMILVCNVERDGCSSFSHCNDYGVYVAKNLTNYIIIS